MKLLLAFLSVMTFTVLSKNSVSKEGACPSNMQVEYSNTYQKGHVRKDDVAALMLTQLGGVTVEQVEVYVRSNKDCGAGKLEVRANGVTVGALSGSLREWVGAYDNQNFHAIPLLAYGVSNVQELTIQLIGTVSSLYIEKYVITYGWGAGRRVTLMNRGTVFEVLDEASGGQGVLLPEVPVVGAWQFAGWSETEPEEGTTKPHVYPANSTYYPNEDCTLWAVYAWEANAGKTNVTELQTGEYMYVDAINQMAMAGVPENGKCSSAEADREDMNQHYTITFSANKDTATIYHTNTGTSIGYSGTKLAVKASPWLVYHAGEATAFYTLVNGRTYMLMPDNRLSADEEDWAGLRLVGNISETPTVLQSVEVANTIYSAYPNPSQAVEMTPCEGHEIRIPFGIYDLRIKGGKKELRLNE